MSKTLTEDKDRPSWQVHEFLEGRMKLEQLSKAAESAAQFAIYQKADRIVNHRTLEKRRLAFAEVPEHLRELVETEVRRLWELRKRPEL